MGNKEAVAKYRLKNKNSGRCAFCPNQASKGYVTCEACREKANEASNKLRKQRNEIGVCRECGKPTVEGLKVCTEHRDIQNKRNRDKHRKFREQGLCKACSSYAIAGQSLCEIHKKKEAEYALNRKFKSPERILHSAAKSRAKMQNVPFNLLFEDIVIPKFCPILEIPLAIGTGGNPTINSPSLDKIIPELGYVKDNIQVISHKANTIKNNATLEDLIKVGEWAKKELLCRA
jgi:hypothetical protein